MLQLHDRAVLCSWYQRSTHGCATKYSLMMAAMSDYACDVLHAWPSGYGPLYVLLVLTLSRSREGINQIMDPCCLSLALFTAHVHQGRQC